MWRWVLMFLGVSVVAAMYGFNGHTAGEVGFAKLIFFLCLVGLGVSVVAWITSSRRRQA